MPELVPSGYLSIGEALNRLGRELFPAARTGEEHKARRGLIGKEEWIRIKDLPPARGAGPPRSEMLRTRAAFGRADQTPHASSDPSDPLYQAEYEARERYEWARDQLRASLERGDFEAAALNPFSGTLHPVPASLWRRHDADRMIEKGQAPIPGSRNTGELLVKQFAEANEPKKPLPQAKIPEVIAALEAKLATESLTRPQQEDFLRQTFASYQLTARTIRKIFRAVPVLTGRPKKSDRGI
jgi:hypothetical protein